jgi:hypothetical protein
MAFVASGPAEADRVAGVFDFETGLQGSFDLVGLSREVPYRDNNYYWLWPAKNSRLWTSRIR